MGGVTAYNMNTGDKAWWIPNGGFEQPVSNEPMFKDVKLPPVGAAGQPQVNEPAVFVQLAPVPQPPLFTRHSFTSLQVTPWCKALETT